MSKNFDVSNGERFDLEILGETVKAGFNEVNGVPYLAYFPVSSRRPPVGHELDLGTTGLFSVEKVEQSPYVMRMVLLTLKKGR